ncbi:MAG TPA: DUF4193 family protein [Acidimicrobiales bacterium]|nr:DUF4193 family protein [Acidimicrobiales bacterium]
MPDDLDDVPGPEDLEDLDDEDLESLDADDELDEDALADDELDEDELAEDVLDEELEVVGDEVPLEAVEGEALAETTTTAPAERSGEESDEEEDEEPDDEDVEASLDVILKERLVVEDEPEDEELTDVEDRTEMTERVLPKQPDEFVCRSCFLVKHPSQLADKKKMLCRDCV